MKDFLTLQNRERTVVYEGELSIVLSPEVYHKLMRFVQAFPGEVSGCGLVDKIETKGGNIFVVTDVFLPERQDNTYASTDIGEGTLHDLSYTLLRKGIDTSKVKLHWHSHGSMDVFHSATDKDNYKSLNNNEWLVSLVLNKNNTILGRIDFYSPFQVSISGVQVAVNYVVDEQVRKETEEEIKKLQEYMKTKEEAMKGRFGYHLPERVGQVQEDSFTEDIDKQLQQELKITKRMLRKLQMCEEYDKCVNCKDEVLCNKYQVLLNNLSYNYAQGGEFGMEGGSRYGEY